MLESGFTSDGQQEHDTSVHKRTIISANTVTIRKHSIIVTNTFLTKYYSITKILKKGGNQFQIL